MPSGCPITDFGHDKNKKWQFLDRLHIPDLFAKKDSRVRMSFFIKKDKEQYVSLLNKVFRQSSYVNASSHP